ncbi:MAG: MFS transporter [Acidiferrobacterales bacterium]|nr:MFS transporter [Acidiferrobacterales bacterium]
MTDSDTKSSNPIARLLLNSTNIQDNEVRAAIASFLFIFVLMAGYFLLRPVRDAMASDWSDAEVSWLWTLNFFISTVIVFVYGFAVTRLNFKKLVPSIYLFFVASFVVFYFISGMSDDTVLIDKSFYVWVSVYALFHVSVFWSLMADTFSKGQAARLFSVFAAGASIGASVGSFFAGILPGILGSTQPMMLITAILVLFTLPLILFLYKQKNTDLGNADLAVDVENFKIGGNPVGGFKAFFSNPYLLAIGAFIILYTGVGSFVYFFQKNLFEDFSLEQRTSIYGYRDLIVNVTTFVLAFVVTGRLVPKLGMTFTLAIIPFLMIIGMGMIALTPLWLVAVFVWIASRAGNYGLTRPAREMLFTQVSREDRFKAKPVIDIVAYRGGDVIMAWLFTFLTSGIGLGLAMVAAVGAGIMAVWTALAVFLGRIYERSKSNETP